MTADELRPGDVVENKTVVEVKAFRGRIRAVFADGTHRTYLPNQNVTRGNRS